MLNHVHLIGYVGSTPKVRLTREGTPVLNFSLATHRTTKTPEEEWKTYTTWHQISLFKENLIPWASETLRIGSLVVVYGELSYSKWEDSFKQRRRNAHILVAGPASKILHLKSGEEAQDKKDESPPPEVPSYYAPEEESLLTSSPSHKEPKL